MSTWHLTYATDGRNPLLRNEADYRQAARTLGRVVGSHAVLFNIVDDHIHLILWCESSRRGRLAQGLLSALRPVCSAEIEPARVRPVESRSHMRWLLTYVLEQTVKHGIVVHPALWSGNCFVDLIGARLLPGLELQLSKALPRYRLRDIYGAVGLSKGPITPSSLDAVRVAGIGRIVAATSAALAVAPELSGNAAPTVLARRAAAQLAVQAGIGTAEIAWALQQAPRSARRLLEPAVDRATLNSIRTRLALQDAVQSVGT